MEIELLLYEVSQLHSLVPGTSAAAATPVRPVIRAADIPPPTAIAADATTPPPGSSTPVRTVVNVVDGDTIKLNDGRTVRILGIDTPETVAPGEPVECWGPEATMFARRTLLNMSVMLVVDSTQDQLDVYGRTLSYVVLPDGRDFSVLAAEAGHARASLGDVTVQRSDEISAAESRARAAGLGLWGPACAPPQPAAAQQQPTATQPAPTVAQPQPVVPKPVVPQPEPGPAPEPDPEPSVYYSNCDEARADGAAPLHAGEPGYRTGLDGDKDGVACE